MVSLYDEVLPVEIVRKLLDAKHNSEAFPLDYRVVLLTLQQLLAGIMHWKQSVFILL